MIRPPNVCARERNVALIRTLGLCRAGYTAPEIARILCVSTSTAKSYATTATKWRRLLVQMLSAGAEGDVTVKDRPRRR